MIKIVITDAMREEAESQAIQLGILKGSVLSGAGNVTGFLGEICVREYLLQCSDKVVENVSDEHKYNYDLLVNNTKIDVKTNKYGMKPLKHYSADIYASSLHQETEGYIFCHINNAMDTCWILGSISKKKFLSIATLRVAGSVHPRNNNYVLKSDSYSVRYDTLTEHCTSLKNIPETCQKSSHNP